MKEITISPVTRVEGHANIRVFLNDRGRSTQPTSR